MGHLEVKILTVAGVRSIITASMLFGFEAGPRACVYLASFLTSLPLIQCASPQKCITSKGALPCFPCLVSNLSRVIF